MGDVTEVGSLNHSPDKKVLILNYLKTTYLRFWKDVVERVAVIKFRMNNRCSTGTDSPLHPTYTYTHYFVMLQETAL